MLQGPGSRAAKQGRCARRVNQRPYDEENNEDAAAKEDRVVNIHAQQLNVVFPNFVVDVVVELGHWLARQATG